MPLKLRRLSNALGAEICDIDVSKPMSEGAFGELDKHDALPRDRHPDYPELLLVTNRPNPDGTPSDTRYTGRPWHTDMSFTPQPSLGSLLRCYNLPEVGGDTLFANMTMAYDTLSEGMKKLIADLHGIHLSGTRKIGNDAAAAAYAAEQKRINPPIAQPVRLRGQTPKASGA